MHVCPGLPYPLGATWDGSGVNFAIFSENATRVELCLFNSPSDKIEAVRVELPERTHQVWHGYISDIWPGQLYGYRISGPYHPEAGHRFNPNKLLLDPYAKSIGRGLTWNDAVYGYTLNDSRIDLSFDERDSAPWAPLGMVVDPAYTWGDDTPPRTPWHKTVIYEMHVRGFTKEMPGVPPDQRGTFAGVASDAALEYLKRLGVTAVELMPVHHFVSERPLVMRGLTNYWGYNSLAFFAPEPWYSSGNQPSRVVKEFKWMVRRLHQAGIEVILDVVYNHTAEGNESGPTLCFRGVDNASYYHLVRKNPRFHMDFTGCGNTLNVSHPRVLQLIMDSLRYWVTEMHVDGFRFDLASALARELYDVDRLSAFFDIIQQDPVLSRVKLIAEPWDVGPGGYQVGNFPVLWTEWNGKYRDCVRRFWRGDGGTMNELATRLTGSSDLYANSGRQPHASINFITAHDGFTLRDLVSYAEKHNEANGEDNRDGTDANWSSNHGVEGPTDDPAINELRDRQVRNLLATLILAQGVPMIVMGDEFGHTQGGNNNAYCHDSQRTWIDWTPTPERLRLLEFTRRLIQIRQSQPALRRRKFFHGRPIRGQNVKDIYWLNPNGREMDNSDWLAGHSQALGLFMAGELDELDEDGYPVVGDWLLLLLNAGDAKVNFEFPPRAREQVQTLELLLTTDDPGLQGKLVRTSESYPLPGKSLALFRWRPDRESHASMPSVPMLA
ncbi:MAG: glycogen debranching protein GlgX [Planctomycetaceae bacterium]|nr:glycogen debranching protein GlgX [Planctomycetaceae bacterium]